MPCAPRPRPPTTRPRWPTASASSRPGSLPSSSPRSTSSSAARAASRRAEKQSTLQNYVADPEVRKRAWQSRLESPAWKAQPNTGHRALVTLERRGKLDTLITQNIDGLHQAAGSAPDRVIEIHGTMREVVCLDCGERAPMERALARVRAGEADPPCRSCRGILKSATISFGQGLVPEDLQRAQQAAARCDLMLTVGTKLSVYQIAGVVPVAKRARARVV